MITTVSTVLADGSNNAIIAVGVVVLGLALLVLWIATIISILRNDRFTGGGKFLWFVVIIAFPFLGCLGWFLFGRNAKIVKSPIPPPALRDCVGR